VLGIVWKMGPMTPYAIRREFLTSPTPHFSGSAGAVYPLVRRLAERGSLSSESADEDRRGACLYRITPRGRCELREWLTPPLEDADVGAGFDPVRARVYFLESLTPGARRRLLKDAGEASRRKLSELRADELRYEESGDVCSRMASIGVRRAIEARIGWLEEAAREFERAGLI